MKKIFIYVLALFLCACHVNQPKQVPVNLDEEIVGLEDIPLTNMPGHAPPETPLECICPKMFGLDHNPCCPPKQPFAWYHSFYDAVMAANGEKMVLVVYRRHEDDTKELMESLNTKCAKKVLDKHYVGLILDDWYADQDYDMLRQTSQKPLKWYPKDYVVSPTVMFVATFKENNQPDGGGNYMLMLPEKDNQKPVTAVALPISFDGKINVNMCVLLKKYYKASKQL